MDQSDTSVVITSKTEHKLLPQNGYTIHYFTSGEVGKPLLIFLHAAFADHRCFDKQIDFFTVAYRVVTIDLLGHGLSKIENAKDQIDQSATHVMAILKAEGYDKVHLVGLSMGSLLAQHVAIQFPQHIHSLTAVGGYPIHFDNSEIIKAQYRQNMKWLFMALFSMTSFRKYIASMSLTQPAEQQRFFEMAQGFTRQSFKGMAGLRNVLQKRDIGIRTYPLLLICGEKDLKLALDANEKWHEAEPESKYIIIKNAGHCANMENAIEFNEQLKRFIESTGH